MFRLIEQAFFALISYSGPLADLTLIDEHFIIH